MSNIIKRVLSALLIISLCGCSPVPAEDDGVFRIVLDAGHGGSDPGAVYENVFEKDINLSVALLVKEELNGIENVDVTMTRTTDVFVELSKRAEIANRLHADLFVSIHSNALPDRSEYSGVFTFYHPNKESDSAVALKLQDAVTALTGANNRGILSADYAVLRRTDMPAALIEIGFMTCPEELALLQSAEYQALLAKGIAEGILSCI